MFFIIILICMYTFLVPYINGFDVSITKPGIAMISYDCLSVYAIVDPSDAFTFKIVKCPSGYFWRNSSRGCIELDKSGCRMI